MNAHSTKSPRRKKRRARRTGRASLPAPGARNCWAPLSEHLPFIDETLAYWQPRAQRQLTREDAREIIENVSGFFSILQEWAAAEELNTATADPSLDTYRTTRD